MISQHCFQYSAKEHVEILTCEMAWEGHNHLANGLMIRYLEVQNSVPGNKEGRKYPAASRQYGGLHRSTGAPGPAGLGPCPRSLAVPGSGGNLSLQRQTLLSSLPALQNPCPGFSSCSLALARAAFHPKSLGRALSLCHCY